MSGNAESDEAQLRILMAHFVRDLYRLNNRPKLSELCELLRDHMILEILRRGSKAGRPLYESSRTFAEKVDQFPGQTARARLRKFARAQGIKNIERALPRLEQRYARSRKHLKKT